MILYAFDSLGSGVGAAWERLRAGESALDALEAGVRQVEANPDDHSVGLGGWPNLLGDVELDAAVMDGQTRMAGAVGGLRGFAHPVSVARAVMEELPHVMLVGEGAAKFASETRAEKAELLTREARLTWQERRAAIRNKAMIRQAWHAVDPMKAGTTVYLGQDSAGNIAAVTSTSGMAWKYPGRVGDTPIIGAGLYADNRYGAAACIGLGELAIRSSAARSVILYMKTGMSVEEAVREVLRDMLELQEDQGYGQVAVYGIDTEGGHFSGVTSATRYLPIVYYAAGDMKSPEREEVACIS